MKKVKNWDYVVYGRPLVLIIKELTYDDTRLFVEYTSFTKRLTTRSLFRRRLVRLGLDGS